MWSPEKDIKPLIGSNAIPKNILNAKIVKLKYPTSLVTGKITPIIFSTRWRIRYTAAIIPTHAKNKIGSDEK